MPSAQNSNASPLPGDEEVGVEEAVVNDQISPTTADHAVGQAPHAQVPLDGALLLEGYYAGKMDMAADSDTVGRYLNSHRGWFTRCAHPMQVEALSDHGYGLVVGRFSVLGYEVEPKVGLYLSPLDHQVYRIDTIPVPGYVPPGYDVDFHAVMRLQDGPNATPPATNLTQVDWDLSLAVKIHMPRLLNSVPRSLLKSSGDRLLNQVVRQVSKRLTRKVQDDFHHSHNLPLPESYRGHHFWSNWGR
ncbi:MULTISPECIES: DUF1997 domain-containing protein [unclassified Nodosilinea]|uniref:DUF1997 domain-containing protein n=1 Tax=Leptolyngbya subtilissima DQ-A4 TaxID=2933933 RepID=A0ABV0K0U2_9CYAN|nr:MULTISPECIES: DUF1997 domain-containing protein [unclassified Nodosilinea]MBD2109097.1 DUF1997 domain-containing protein [Nodosilinea sp. FACHB-13]MBD2111170.1 DUF1997 domain-containing protein [Nodosilinea sp. FACHB-141]